MKLYQCMHHTDMMCHEQGRQLLHFWFLNYFPMTRFHIVNRVWAITPTLYGIYRERALSVTPVRPVCLSVRPYVPLLCPGHNSKSL